MSFVVYKLAMRYPLYPKIRARDVHTRPTPRLGGVAMFLGILVAFAVSWLLSSQFGVLGLIFSDQGPILAILGASLLIVVIGVADDIWDLDWMTKLAGQFVAAGLVAWLGVQIYSLPIGGLTVGSPVMSIVITLFAIVLVMNAINFIDGLDGLVAGVALIANGVFFVYSYLQQSANNLDYFNLAALVTAVLIGACIGFLPLNFHPAKMFMGDAGALLVGLLMAVSAITVTGQIDPNRVQTGLIGHSEVLVAYIPIILPFAILIIPLLDFSLAVLRRVNAGKSPFSADRKHLHHRLLDMGHSHLHAVLILYAWTAVASVGVLTFLFVPWWVALILIAVGFGITAGFTLAPLSNRKRREAKAQNSKADDPDVAAGANLDPLDAAAEANTPETGADR